jgi:hypothetical protein
MISEVAVARGHAGAAAASTAAKRTTILAGTTISSRNPGRNHPALRVCCASGAALSGKQTATTMPTALRPSH